MRQHSHREAQVHTLYTKYKVPKMSDAYLAQLWPKINNWPGHTQTLFRSYILLIGSTCLISGFDYTLKIVLLISPFSRPRRRPPWASGPGPAPAAAMASPPQSTWWRTGWWTLLNEKNCVSILFKTLVFYFCQNGWELSKFWRLLKEAGAGVVENSVGKWKLQILVQWHFWALLSSLWQQWAQVLFRRDI